MEVNPRVAEVDVRLVNVTKKFGDAIAVDAITLDVSDKAIHQRVVDVLNACATAGIQGVTFAGATGEEE